MIPLVKAFFNEATYTVSYVVWDPNTKKTVIIDPVLDFDRDAGRTSNQSADEILTFIQENELDVDWVLETHAHADHLSAAHYLKHALGCRTGIGMGITKVQKVCAGMFNFEAGFRTDGSQFDYLFEDNEKINLGSMKLRVLHTPGHTPACVTYIIGEAAFVGDTIFMPDFGTARCDFPGGDAAVLYVSIQRILSLPEETKLFTGHDYKAKGRDYYAWEASVCEQKAKNIHVNTEITLQDFVNIRIERDKNLPVPRLLFPSLQVNVRAGEMPPPEENGVSYLKLPIRALAG
ncbi:MBL fold metallo-hydrolase [Terasakiella sp. SH-1]|uniref:MBL fold metallo-hydrolase n=1 Tax=Terasakiella sp. SH-1 TaxID=2560057 RepID=UPI0010730F25|nr:MBL fold metallo-hydrolase [Terasakiella sp. SH-1]